MIKIYQDGSSFLKENKDYLDLNKYLAVFFYLDGEVLKEASKKNYAIKAYDDKEKILAIKLEAYSLLLYGSGGKVRELLTFLKENEYEFSSILSSTTLGEPLKEFGYTLKIGMDFMEAKEVTEASSKEVIECKEEDISCLYNLVQEFFIEVGLDDKVSIDSIRKSYSSFRCIKENGQIISIAKIARSTDKDLKISCVYTLKEYRGRGYARKVVNSAKNEILSLGKIATLNVDQKNKITNHLYSSLGFKKVFSQGVYELDEV